MESTDADDVLSQGAAEESQSGRTPTKGYFDAILRSEIELSHISRTRMLLNSDDPDARDLAAEYFPKLWEAYIGEDPQGIRSHALGGRAPWGMVLYWDGHFDWDYQIELANLVTTDWEKQAHLCAQAITEAGEILKDRERTVIQRQLFTLMERLFKALDYAALDPESRAVNDRMSESVAFVEERSKEIDAKVRSIVLRKDKRIAQQRYLSGMLPGLIFIGAVLTLVAVFTPVESAAIEAFAAGSLGAVLSVLSRTSRAQVADSLDIDYQVGKGLIFVAGLFRPAVGALLATVLYVLIRAGLIPFKLPDPPEREFFVIGISFLAGFSERLAQDALVRTSRAIF